MAAPTRARYTVLTFAVVIAIITYLDRVAISSAGSTIRAEFGLTPAQLGWVFGVFNFAYAAFEIPSGWMGDTYGPRKVLTRIVLWWSAFTALTGATWNYTSLLVARFLFGVGEAGAFPNISRSFARWFPATERGSAHGFVFMGTRLGGALTPPLVVMLMNWIGWRRTFVAFGLVGVVWCIFWWRWFRDDPSIHPSANAEEATLIRDGMDHSEPQGLTVREFFSPNLVFICCMYFTMGYTLSFYLSWLPTYLQEVRGFTRTEAGNIAGAVLFAGAIGTFIGGKLTDALVRRYGLKIGRSIGAVSLPLGAVLVIGVALAQTPFMAAALLAITLFIADFGVSACWSMCHDVGRRHAGIVSGAMNTVGSIGATLSPLVVGYAVQWWNSWTIPFYITAGVYIWGAAFTLLVDPRKPLVAKSPLAEGRGVFQHS